MNKTVRLLLILFLGGLLLAGGLLYPHYQFLCFLLSLLLLLIGMLLLYPEQHSSSPHIDAQQTERARLEAAINSLHVGFMVIDADHNLITLNARAQALLHVVPPLSYDFFVKNLPIISKNFTIQKLEEKLSETIDLKEMIDECILQKKPVEKREVAFGKKYFHLMLSPIMLFKQKPESIGCVLLIEDATQARLLEKSRDEFFSIASHELRTPLTAIRGNVSLIQQYFQEKIADDRYKQMLSDIHASSNRLITIVDDFLDSSRLEQGRITLEKEPVDVQKMIVGLVKEYEAVSKEKKLTLKLEKFLGKSEVLGDTNRVKQILINLLSNSLRYTEKGGVVFSLEEMPHNILIRISDTGIGIAEDVQGKLFTKFQRVADNAYMKDSTIGSGLGLYISRLLAVGMGGDVALEKTEPGKGSTFVLSLPKV